MKTNFINMDQDGQDSQDNLQPAQPTNIKQWKNKARKATETDFEYTCEWRDCNQTSKSMNQFNKHVHEHRIEYLQMLWQDCDKGEVLNLETELEFTCPWRECGAVIEGTLSEFSRHVYYHTYHQLLKYLGQHIQKVECLQPCVLDSESRNIIPDLPEGLVCQWKDCGKAFDNPYVFYGHVGYHCEDFPKGKDKGLITCQWVSCSHTVKSAYKIKEHMRSHTQAKQVACPTCGSLFSCNTKFIDHLKRQTNKKEFICAQCSKQFGSDRILKDHMRHHVNFYKCEICDMTCPSPSHLRDHIRYRHSNERQFACDQCDHSSKSANDLRRHMIHHERHEDEFECKRCDKAFSSRIFLMQHYADEHQRKDTKATYQCTVCPSRFTRGMGLTTHLQDVHDYKWPSGHRRFRYKLHEDGLRRLQTIRFEKYEVAQQVLESELTTQAAQQSNSQSVHAPNLEHDIEEDSGSRLVIAIDPSANLDSYSSKTKTLRKSGRQRKDQIDSGNSKKEQSTKSRKRNVDEDANKTKPSKKCRKKSTSFTIIGSGTPNTVSNISDAPSQSSLTTISTQQDDSSSLSSFLSKAASLGFSGAEAQKSLDPLTPSGSIVSTEFHSPVKSSSSWASDNNTATCRDNFSRITEVSSHPDFRSPSKISWSSTVGQVSFSPEKLGFTVTETTQSDWQSPVKNEAANSQVSIQDPSPISFSLQLQVVGQDGCQASIVESQAAVGQDLYNLEMLGTVALETSLNSSGTQKL